MSWVKDLYSIYMDAKERKYAAAKNSVTHNIPTASSGTVNDELDSSWDEVTDRTLALVRDFPIFAGAVSRMESFITGPGIRPQVNILRNDGSIDTDKSQAVEQAFNKWAGSKECDTAGRLTFWEMQALDDRMQGEFGESIFVEDFAEGKYTLSPIEPLNLADDGFKVHKETEGGGILWRGIEYNPKNHRVIAYHFKDPSDANSLYHYKTIRVPAKKVKHLFKTLRAGQLRGITPFAPALLSAYQLRDYMGSELSAQMMSSKWLAWVTAPMSNQWTDQSSRSNVEQDNVYDRYVKTLDNATIEYLKTGEQVTVNTSQRQANSFAQFNEIVIRYVSGATGLPYELLSQDYSGLNFTTLRAVRNDFKQELRPKWQRKIDHLCNPVFRTWLQNAVLNKTVQLDGYFKDPERYHNSVRWITPSLDQIDPMKEFGAELMKVRAGMKSPQSVIKGMGEDPEKVLQEASQWKKLCTEEDLVFPELTNQTPMVANFEIIEEPEEEVDPIPQEKDTKPEKKMGRDQDGNIYEEVDGKWRALEK